MSTFVLFVKGSDVDFGSRLRDERKQAGLSQIDAAKACGVSREMWGRYERSSAMPGADVVARMNAIGIDTHYVMTGETPAFRATLNRLAKATKEATELHSVKEDRVAYVTKRFQELDDDGESELINDYRACGADSRAVIRRTASALAAQDGRKELTTKRKGEGK